MQVFTKKRIEITILRMNGHVIEINNIPRLFTPEGVVIMPRAY